MTLNCKHLRSPGPCSAPILPKQDCELQDLDRPGAGVVRFGLQHLKLVQSDPKGSCPLAVSDQADFSVCPFYDPV